MSDLHETAAGAESVRRDGHLPELTLRRLFAGESLGAGHDVAAAHAARCPECARRLAGLADEQRAFEARISFDRFAAGVERAARFPERAAAAPRRWWARPASTRSFMTVMGAGSIAAALALVVGARPIFQQARLRHAREAAVEASNRTKGAGPASVTFRIAPPPPDEGPQRTAAAEGPEPLSMGERIRVGVQAGKHRYLFAVSIDDQAVVTPLYPESGTSMPLPGGGMHYLPDSLELTGHGAERVVVLLSEQPLELDGIRRAVAAAFRRAGGDLAHLPNLALPGTQFHRTFLKP